MRSATAFPSYGQPRSWEGEKRRLTQWNLVALEPVRIGNLRRVGRCEGFLVPHSVVSDPEGSGGEFVVFSETARIEELDDSCTRVLRVHP